MTVDARTENNYTIVFTVSWGLVTQEMLRSWDLCLEGVEYGACGVALLLVHKLTDYIVVERAVRGTGIDYWLGPRELLADPLPLQHAARLEASGILRGDTARITARLKEKLDQTAPTDATLLPAYAAVVEFGSPASWLVRK